MDKYQEAKDRMIELFASLDANPEEHYEAKTYVYRAYRDGKTVDLGKVSKLILESKAETIEYEQKEVERMDRIALEMPFWAKVEATMAKLDENKPSFNESFCIYRPRKQKRSGMQPAWTMAEDERQNKLDLLVQQATLLKQRYDCQINIEYGNLHVTACRSVHIEQWESRSSLGGDWSASNPNLWNTDTARYCGVKIMTRVFYK